MWKEFSVASLTNKYRFVESAINGGHATANRHDSSLRGTRSGPKCHVKCRVFNGRLFFGRRNVEILKWVDEIHFKWSQGGLKYVYTYTHMYPCVCVYVVLFFLHFSISVLCCSSYICVVHALCFLVFCLCCHYVMLSSAPPPPPTHTFVFSLSVSLSVSLSLSLNIYRGFLSAAVSFMSSM